MREDGDTSDRPGPAGGAITARIVSGASLAIVGNLVVRLIGIASLAALGRLLLPADFGIVAIALIVVSLSEALMNRQWDLALIRTTDPTPRHYATAFTLSAGWGLLAGTLVFLSAEPVAAAMGEPGVAPVLRVMALAPVLDGLRNPRFVDFERSLAFRPEILTTLTAKGLQTAVAILLALLLRNHWAMVAGTLAFSASRSALTHVLRPWTPRLSLAEWRSFVGFGGWLSATGLVGFVMTRSDTALVGSRLGTAEVGVYNLGWELAQMATAYIADPLARTVYPGLSAVSADRPRMVRAYLRAQETLLGLVLPLGTGAALLAPEIVAILLGPGWEGAVPVLAALTPALALSGAVYPVQALLMVENRTRSMFLRNLAVALVQVPLLVLGIWTLGLAGAIMARIAATLLHTGLSLAIAARLAGTPLLAPFHAARRSLIACLVMAAALLWLRLDAAPAADPFVAFLAAGKAVLLGAILHGTTLLALWLLAGRPEGFETIALRIAGSLLRRLTGSARNHPG